VNDLWGNGSEPPRPELHQYDPIRPQGLNVRKTLERIGGVVFALGAAALKFGFVFLKFASIFIAVGGYALIWGWRFAIGFVLLILVHEMGHYVEAKRRGLEPRLPMFIPFIGAYVAFRRSEDEVGNALIALAGPFAGGLASLACYGYGESTGSQFMLALAFTGFLLNAFNLLPVLPLDGGMTLHAIRALRRDRDSRATLMIVLYVVLAALLVLGMIQAHVPQHRL
jgi:Zn-dependent protease